MIMPLICATFSCLICVIKEKDGKFVVQVSISVSLVIKAPYWQVLRAPNPGFWIIPSTTNVWRYGWHRFHLLSNPLTPHSPQPMLFSLFYMSSVTPLLFTHRSDFLKYQRSSPLLLINISLCRHCSLRDGAGLSSLWSGLVCVQTNYIYFWCRNPASKSFKEPQDFPRPCCLSLGNYGFQIFFFLTELNEIQQVEWLEWLREQSVGGQKVLSKGRYAHTSHVHSYSGGCGFPTQDSAFGTGHQKAAGVLFVQTLISKHC